MRPCRGSERDLRCGVDTVNDGEDIVSTLEGFAPIMDIRDQFACAAMQGDMSCQSPEVFMLNLDIDNDQLAVLCRQWYRIADAMLKERDK